MSAFACFSNVFFIWVLIPLQVTETRTGPLGCSSYDNLDSVSSILLQSPESKLHLQGKQTPAYQYFPYAAPQCSTWQGSRVKLLFWPLKLKGIFSHTWNAHRWTREVVLCCLKLNVNAFFNWGWDWDGSASQSPLGIPCGYRCLLVF